MEVVCQHLLIGETPIFVEGELVGLERVFAAEIVRKEIAGEVDYAAFERIEAIGAGVAPYFHAERSQICV